MLKWGRRAEEWKMSTLGALRVNKPHWSSQSPFSPPRSSHPVQREASSLLTMLDSRAEGRSDDKAMVTTAS